MMTVCGWVLFIFGIIGAIKLARQYTGRIAQVLLTIAGGISLWMVLMSLYNMLLESPVPKILWIGGFPMFSLIVMTVTIQKVPKVDSKEKRKAK